MHSKAELLIKKDAILCEDSGGKQAHCVVCECVTKSGEKLIKCARTEMNEFPLAITISKEGAEMFQQSQIRQWCSVRLPQRDQDQTSFFLSLRSITSSFGQSNKHISHNHAKVNKVTH